MNKKANVLIVDDEEVVRLSHVEAEDLSDTLHVANDGWSLTETGWDDERAVVRPRQRLQTGDYRQRHPACSAANSPSRRTKASVATMPSLINAPFWLM